MKRDNYTLEGYIKEYGNGNLTLKLDADTIENINSGRCRDTALYYIGELLWSLDTYIIGDPISLGNYDAGYILYNVNSDNLYILSGEDINNAESGKMIRLYAHKPDTEERQYIEEVM